MTGQGGHAVSYGQLTRFLVPLLATQVLAEFGGQFLNGGMARVPEPTQTLAAYGLAWGLVGLVTSTLSQVRQVALVLVDSHTARRTVQRVVIYCGVGLSLVLGGLGYSTWAIDTLHGIRPELGALVRQALFWLAPIVLFDGFSRLYSGLMLRVHRTTVLTLATTAHITVSIGSVFLLLPTKLVQQDPIALPILVTYAGAVADLAVLAWGYHTYVRGHLPGTGERELTSSYVLRFFWPLALVMAIQGLSRPVINLFVARGIGGEEALAALAIVYSLAHMLYVWLNDMRSLAPAFLTRSADLVPIRRFMAGCGAVSLLGMFVLFWTPLREVILEQGIALEPGLAERCKVPLLFCVAFSPLVTVRAYYHGLALSRHRTRSLAPSAPFRLAAIVAALLILPGFGLSGATLGIVALLAGFLLETAAAWWFGRGPVPLPADRGHSISP